MNCQTFESLINELAHDRLLEATTHESAHAHTEDCPRCAARLADERTLTAGLRSLTSEAHATKAPQRVETALLAAFRAQQAAAARGSIIAVNNSAESSSPVVRLTPKRLLAQPWVAGTAVAAASMLIVFGFAGIRRYQTRTDRGQAVAQSDASPALLATPLAPTVIEATPRIGAQVSSVANAEGLIVAAEKPASSSYSPRMATEHAERSPRYSRASLNTNRPATSAQQTNQAVAEITTDFMPLSHGNNLSPEDGGQIMRVELPRSALVSFGLPMNVERAGERVKADVLMGEDGVARAIRFVR